MLGKSGIFVEDGIHLTGDGILTYISLISEVVPFERRLNAFVNRPKIMSKSPGGKIEKQSLLSDVELELINIQRDDSDLIP